MGETYEYDVAFSFLSQDEPLAERLHNLVSATLKSFLYSKRQGEIVGTDGAVTFSRIFGEQARLVVVLYRRGWGESPFTRIEQTAIENRAHGVGHDFVLMIPLDQPPTTPPWMPKPRIWYDLARFGEETAAAIIEERVRQAGGEPRAETPEQQLARLGDDVRAENERQRVLHTDGVNMAREETERLFRELERIAAASQTGYRVEAERHPRGNLALYLRGGEVTASVFWQSEYANSLDNSGLIVSFTRALLRFNTVQLFLEEPPQLGRTNYTFDLTQGLQRVWHLGRGTATISTSELAAEIVRSLANHIRKIQKV